MHAWDDQKLTERQRKFAVAANRVHQQIQQLLAVTFALDGDAAGLSSVETPIHHLYLDLANCEQRLWGASRMSVTLIHSNANVLLRFLTPLCDATAIDHIVVCAQTVQARLQCLTNLQVQTMLSMPHVALAYNVAMDCEAEFDNEEAFARWRKAAADIER